MAKALLIDGNAIGFASQMATKLTVGGREVQAIFGFIRTLRDVVEQFRGFEPLVLWDHRAQWRFDLYPDYKGNRERDAKMVEMKEKYKAQKPLIGRALYTLGISQLLVRGAEADDMAGLLTAKITGRGGKVVLCTGDRDWLQLMNENVVWFDPIRGQRVTAKNFSEFTGYATARQFLEGKALTGDASDNIKGVGGIGEKGAPEFLMQWGSVEEFFRRADAGELPPKLPKAWERFARNECPPRSDVPMRDAYRRNLKLMDLQSVPKPDPKLVKVTRGRFNPEAFRELCEELAFRSILLKFEQWIQPFQTLTEQTRNAA